MIAADAYSALPWQTFFAAEVGAAAALTGLLFVAVSINLQAILSFPRLPARAAETLALLLLVAVIASLALIPQSPTALAAEMIACAGVLSTTESGTHAQLLPLGGLCAALYNDQCEGGQVQSRCRDGDIMADGSVRRQQPVPHDPPRT